MTQQTAPASTDDRARGELLPYLAGVPTTIPLELGVMSA